jgi:hypothetical protein
LPQVGGRAVPGDYDNDGDLDLVVVGGSDGGPVAKVYRNDGVPANHPPSIPTGLAASVQGSQATFLWNPASDAETPTLGLSYNLRVGTTPGGSEVVSAMADEDTGYRLIPAVGNTQKRVLWTVTLPVSRPLYWGVQAVDGACAGSGFAVDTLAISGVGDAALPQAFALRGNSPNPFSGSTRIIYDVPRPGPVSLAVFDVAGRRVRSLVGQVVLAGRHQVVWDAHDDGGRPVPAGLYYLRMSAGAYHGARKALLLESR